MTSVMLIGCPFSTRTSRLIDLNRRNSDFLPRRCVGRLCLRTTTASGRGRTLSIRSSSDTAMVIDEKAVSFKMMREIKIEASRMEESVGAVACLAVIFFGNRQDSARFRLPCGIVGIRTFIVRLPQDSSEEKVLSHVSRLNNDPCVHGILVQSPLPPHIDEHNILNAVSVEKDVEGFHPLNIGLLAMRGREPLFVPRAPQGCMELLRRYNFEIQGKRAVVIGKHNLFDMPAALLLQREGATVSIIHSRTKNPEEFTRQADIVFSAVEQPNMVRGSWIKPGAVVINVGFTLVRDPNDPHGLRSAGDICHEEVRKVASAITPSDFSSAMPLAMLLSNTLTSAKRKHNFMMGKTNVLSKIKAFNGINRPIYVLAGLAFLISVATLAKFNYITPLRFSDRFCNNHGSFDGDNFNIGSQMRKTIETAIFKIHQEMDDLKAFEANSSASGSMFRHVAFLADVLSLVQSVHMKLPSFEERFVDHPLRQRNGDPGEHFMREEIKKYIKIKPNRLGKQNFMGANGTFTSIGHACFAMKKDLEEYMDYDVGEICNDDWRLAQKLMVHGCDPLPRRRCFSRAPQLYHKPFPINESLWKLPDNRNVRWGQYKCKNFACLASNTTARKGFFKCTDCFNLTHHESPRWLNRGEIDPETNQTADFSISEVLEIKPGEMRIGLDFSIGTGTFAARMREQNVTIVSATINLGAPFNEMIALRGLVPLYLTVNQRLPFFDSTLDMIHTTRFLDGWIDLILLDFVLFDWDRVLRPGGLLWIDGFFCLKEDLSDYVEAFKALRYRRHKWVVVPKKDKDDKEVFFSAVLEKPPRPFR